MFEMLSMSQSITAGLVVFILVLIFKGVKVIPQAQAVVIERLGKYSRTLEGGLHLIIPFLDSIRDNLTKQEQMIDIPSQPVITKDNVNIHVNGIVFIKVTDPKLAVYGVVDFKSALANLSTTTLRSEIGQLALDETLSSRDSLNSRILTAIDEASMKWGIKTMRVEISDIRVPDEIEEAMNLEMKAEREKRATELKAEADKVAVIREAEGIKQKAYLAAEATERTADASKYEQKKIAEGQMDAIENINSVLKDNPEAATFLLEKDRIAAFALLAGNTAKDKVVIPYSAVDFVGGLSVVKDVMTPATISSSMNLKPDGV